MQALEQVLPFVLIVGAFWFLLIRPQRRRQRELAATQQGVRVGDEVMLASGVFGRVADLGDETVQLEVSPGVVMKVARGAVVRVVADEALESRPEPPTGDL